jgi:hypothetical protein
MCKGSSFKVLFCSLPCRQFVETVWQNDIKSFSRAYDLICIIDQIHNFAMTQHRQFVIRHLEPWLSRAEALDASTSGISLGEFIPKPEWANIKEASEKARKVKSLQTRNRNWLLRAQMRMREASTQVANTEKMRPQTKTTKGTQKAGKQIQRNRGRPRKANVNPKLRQSPRLLKQGNLKV